MATLVRKTSPLAEVIVAAHNDIKAQIGAGAHFHLDSSEEVSAKANATDLPTSLALCNELIGIIHFHYGNTLAHKVVDATSLPAIGAAVDLASAITAANALKATYNTHRASTTYHYNADSTNSVTATDAVSTQGQLDTLLNDIKTKVNAHMADAPSAKSLRLYGP